MQDPPLKDCSLKWLLSWLAPCVGNPLWRLASGDMWDTGHVTTKSLSFEELSFEMLEPFQRTVFQKRVLRRLDQRELPNLGRLRTVWHEKTVEFGTHVLCAMAREDC